MFWTATFLVNYFPQYLNSYNAHFWSLCVEVQFYVAIGVVILLGGEKWLWIVWPACLTITALRIAEGAYIHIQTHLRGDEILAGACLATLYQTSWAGKLRNPTLTITATFIFWFVSSSTYSALCQYFRPYATVLFMAAVLCLGDSLLKVVLCSRPLRYIATTSYALYVVHPLTIHGWWNEGSIFERYLVKRPISFAMTFAAAHLSTFYWERPWLQAGRQWINQRRMRKSQVKMLAERQSDLVGK
jgi:peptidoglycan/LPS O-acetylase OafA/YrhL